MSDAAEMLKDLLDYYPLMPEKYRLAIRKVLANNEQLRAEVESRRSQQNALEDCVTIANSERDGALADNERLRAALEKLREAIRICRSDSARAAMREVLAMVEDCERVQEEK